MEKTSIFYLIFILTIIAVRTAVFLFPDNKFRISGIIVHHFWIGVILVGIALLLGSFGYRWILLALGLALVADELVYMLLGAGPVANYWNIYSVSGAILDSFIVFMIRAKLANI